MGDIHTIFGFIFSNGAVANCLLTKENGNVYEATGTLLGQKFNPNQQCQFSYGSSSLLCMVSGQF